MKKLTFTCGFFLLALSVSFSSNRNRMNAAPPLDHALDRYGNICWEDEKAHLDNFAIHTQENSDKIGLIVVYAGRRSCSGEVQARAERARKWVIEKRGVEASRVVWKDGGYRESVTTELWLLPRDLIERESPAAPTLERKEVKVFSRCKGKIYKPAKCDNP